MWGQRITIKSQRRREKFTHLTPHHFLPATHYPMWELITLCARVSAWQLGYLVQIKIMITLTQVTQNTIFALLYTYLRKCGCRRTSYRTLTKRCAMVLLLYVLRRLCVNWLMSTTIIAIFMQNIMRCMIFLCSRLILTFWFIINDIWVDMIYLISFVCIFTSIFAIIVIYVIVCNTIDIIIIVINIIVAAVTAIIIHLLQWNRWVYTFRQSIKTAYYMTQILIRALSVLTIVHVESATNKNKWIWQWCFLYNGCDLLPWWCLIITIMIIIIIIIIVMWMKRKRRWRWWCSITHIWLHGRDWWKR